MERFGKFVGMVVGTVTSCDDYNKEALERAWQGLFNSTIKCSGRLGGNEFEL